MILKKMCFDKFEVGQKNAFLGGNEKNLIQTSSLAKLELRKD